jgi:hypothetical protein
VCNNYVACQSTISAHTYCVNIFCMHDQWKAQTSCLEGINAGRIYFCWCCFLVVLIRTLSCKSLRVANLRACSVCSFKTCFVFKDIWLSCVKIGSYLIMTYFSVCTTGLQNLTWLPGKFLWLRLFRIFHESLPGTLCLVVTFYQLCFVFNMFS